MSGYSDEVEIRGLLYGIDGDKVTCYQEDFINLQESPCGFGDSRTEAYLDLMRQLEAK